MKKSIVLSLISAVVVSAVLVFTACTKDKKIADDSSLWSSAVNSNSDVQVLKSELVSASVKSQIYANSNSWVPVEIPNKMTVYVPGKDWKDEQGNAVNGMIDVDINLIKKAGDNIKNSRPTQTADALLFSGGSYSIQFSQNGKKISNEGYYMLDMKGIDQGDFELFESSDGAMDWRPINDGVSKRVTDPWNDSTFNRDSSVLLWKDTMFRIKCKYKWINCDYYYSYSGKKVNITVKLPQEFGNSNAMVYALDKNDYGVFNIPGRADIKMYKTSAGYNVPEGRTFTIIVVAKIGTKYYFAQKEIIAKEDQIDELTPEEKSQNDVRNLLDAL